jgi:hypothetical protein
MSLRLAGSTVLGHVVAHQAPLRVARRRLEERLAGAVVLAQDADGCGADGVHLLRLVEELRPEDAVLVGEHHDAGHLLLPDLPAFGEIRINCCYSKWWDRTGEFN